MQFVSAYRMEKRKRLTCSNCSHRGSSSAAADRSTVGIDRTQHGLRDRRSNCCPMSSLNHWKKRMTLLAACLRFGFGLAMTIETMLRLLPLK